MQVLLLEPDFWRYLGIARILESAPDITLLGEENHTRILSLRTTPAELKPDVVIVSHSLVLDYSLSILPRLQTLFPKAQLLVEGYDATFETIADLLHAGAQGYFQLSTDRDQLVKALEVVKKGFPWAPRAAVALMARRMADRARHTRLGTAAELLSAEELSIIRFLQQGFTNKEIARALGVADVTVKSHLTKLFRRFNVHGRLQLLAYAMRHHLITDGHQRSVAPGR